MSSMDASGDGMDVDVDAAISAAAMITTTTITTATPLNGGSMELLDESNASVNCKEPPTDSGGATPSNSNGNGNDNGLGVSLMQSSPPPHSYRHSRAYRHFKNPPQPHMCIRTTTEAGEELFINVLSWTRIVIPQEPSDPIPLYGGMRVPPGSPRSPPIVFAVMANPEVLKDSGRHSKDPEERRAMVELMCDFVEAMNPGVKLVRNAVILKDRDISGELKDVWNAVQAQRDREREEQMLQQRQQQHYHNITTQQMFPKSAEGARLAQQEQPHHPQHQPPQAQNSSGQHDDEAAKTTTSSATTATTVGNPALTTCCENGAVSSTAAAALQLDNALDYKAEMEQHLMDEDMELGNGIDNAALSTGRARRRSDRALSPLDASSGGGGGHCEPSVASTHSADGADQTDTCNANELRSSNCKTNANTASAMDTGQTYAATATTPATQKSAINANGPPLPSTATANAIATTTTAASAAATPTALPTTMTSNVHIALVPTPASPAPAAAVPMHTAPTPAPAPAPPTKKDKLGGFLPNGCIFPRFKNNKHKDKDKDKEKEKEPKSKDKEKTLLYALKKSKEKKVAPIEPHSEKTAPHHADAKSQYEKNCINLESEVQKLDLNKIDTTAGNESMFIKLKVAASSAVAK